MLWVGRHRPRRRKAIAINVGILVGRTARVTRRRRDLESHVDGSIVVASSTEFGFGGA
jgi:hypothetical protein